jgi:peptide/nickel transport system permease protein
MQRLEWSVLRGNPLAMAGLVLVALDAAMAIFGSVVAPYPPTQMHLGSTFAPPAIEHLAGTDQFGRDVFSRILVGARVSMLISVFAVTGAVVIGLTLALVTGFLGGIVDLVVTRLIDVFLAIPGLLIALGILAITGPSGPTVALAIAIAYAPTTARVFRTAVVSARSQPYVEASLGTGASTARVLRDDVIPTIIPVFVVHGTALFAFAILDEAALGFLGLGIQPPNPSWGSLLVEGRNFLFQAPWIAVTGGFAVLIAVFGFNLLGDGLRDVFDPRSWHRKV